MPTLAHTPSRVEILETRIAPASITFTDVDGLTVTITSNKGSAAQLTQVAILVAEGAGQELQELRLNDLPNVFKGANISIVKGTLDDSQLVNVGFINAEGIDLGKLTIDGDLGRIIAGDNNSSTLATKKLIVGSLGVQGLNTQAAGGDLASKFRGRLGSLAVGGDFKDASLLVLGVDPDPDEIVNTKADARGSIGNIVIDGNLIGGADAKSGSIYAKGSIGNITVNGSVLGGDGEFSASITSERKMGKVTIAGGIEGGLVESANFSGRIFSSRSMGSVNITGSLDGGGGTESGSVLALGGIGNVTILGDMNGGDGLKSGTVGAGGEIGKITIGSDANGGNITGGAGEQSGGLLSGGSMKAVKIFGDIVGGSEIFSGSITSAGKIASLFVDGSIMGGSGEQSGAIGSSLALGAVNVLGDLVGGDGKNSGNIISTTSIDSVTIERSVIGGAGELSGAIGCVRTLGPVDIGIDLLGGLNLNSGVILAGERMVSVNVDGVVKGSTGINSGIIDSAGEIGSITVGELIGGGSFNSGTIHAAQRLASVTIEEDIEGGSGQDSAMITAGSIGSVVVKGDVLQGSGQRTSSIIAFQGSINSIDVDGAVVLISPQREVLNILQISAGDGIDTATFGALAGIPGLTEGYITARNSIGSLTVENSASYFQIFSGYATNLEPANSRARIDSVTIGTTGLGNIQGIDIVAGVFSRDGQFGTEDDSPILPFSKDAVSRIGAVVVKGNIVATTTQNLYGIVAGRIDSVSIGGNALPLTPGLDFIQLPPGDVAIELVVKEVPFGAAP
jgi:hypothetical protein